MLLHLGSLSQIWASGWHAGYHVTIQIVSINRTCCFALLCRFARFEEKKEQENGTMLHGHLWNRNRNKSKIKTLTFLTYRSFFLFLGNPSSAITFFINVCTSQRSIYKCVRSLEIFSKSAFSKVAPEPFLFQYRGLALKRVISNTDSHAGAKRTPLYDITEVLHI